MEILKINYINESGGKGYMELRCKAFFPCKLKDAKIIFPLVVKFCPSEIIYELKKHFIDEITSCEQELKRYSSKYVAHNQQASDTLQLIATGKQPSGVTVTKEELSFHRSNLTYTNSMCRSDLAAMKKSQTNFRLH